MKSTPTVLVIDDQPVALAALASSVRAVGYNVIEAATVEAALASLALNTPDAVVLDLSLDRPSAALHQVLTARALPVLVVSGIERDALPAAALANAWVFLEKPVADLDLEAAIARLIPLQRALRLPPSPAKAIERAPTQADLAADRAPGSAPPAGYTDPSVQRADALSRRALRGLCAVLTTAMTFYFESHGHTPPLPVVFSLAAMALGAQAVADAIRKRPGVTIGGVAVLVALALVGNATGVREASTLAALGAGALPVVDHLANAANAAVRMKAWAPLVLTLVALAALG